LPLKIALASHACLQVSKAAAMFFRALLAAVLAAFTATFAEPSQHAALLSELRRAVDACPQVGIFDDVSVHLDAGTALLSGRVTSPEKKQELGARAARVAGINGVRNHIVVLPASPADDELRYRIARAVYGHPAFWKHASSRNPPIHIIVEDGHVTLTGIVQTSSERALARALASGSGERSLTSRLRLRNQ
jgi:hyperosmotically inducible periplasmic protein